MMSGTGDGTAAGGDRDGGTASTGIRDPRVGTRLAGYTIQALLGRGGMSVVYLAEQARPRRKVALKLVAPELAGSEAFRRRFLREQELAASIDHPNVLPVYDAGEADGRLWIAMRYVDGTDLRTLLAREGPLPPDRAVAIAGQVASALDAAHTRGLVHRDVKPGNVLLAEGAGAVEHAYLCDFGLTRRVDEAGALTASGQLVGTVDYVAPEQAEGGSVDGRADQYALACVLFECLTGAVPFRRSTELAVVWAHVHQPPPRLAEVRAGLPEGLDASVARGLAKAPHDRHATCTALVTAARDALSPPEGKTDTGSEQTQGPGRKRLAMWSLGPGRRAAWLLLAVAVVALAGAVVAAVALLRGGHGTSPPNQAPVVAPNTAVRIDADTGDIVAVVPVGASPAAVAAGGGLVWVVNRRDATLSEIDPATNRVQATIHLPGSGPVDDQAGPGLAFGNDTAWVANDVDGTVTRIDPSTDAALPPITVGEGPSSVAVAEDAAWVPSQVDGSVARIDVGTNQVKPVRVGRAPSGVAVTQDGSMVWVVNHQDKTVTQLDGRSRQVVRTIQLPVTPDQAAFGDGAVWVTSRTANEVLRIDAQTGKISSTVRVGWSPTAIAYGASRIWITNTQVGWLSSINPATMQVGTYRLGFHPTAVAVDDDRKAVWVTVTS
jgi:DNA-binding beta-propeller fold protein YncE